MKNWKISLAAVLGLLLIASASFAKGALDKVPMYSKHEGSKKAQQQLNEEMLNLLKTKQFKKLRNLYESLPWCEEFKNGVTKGKIPARCQDSVDLYETPNRLITVTVYDDDAHTSAQDATLLNVVSRDKAFYYALTKYYISLYGQDPSVLNAKNYVAFHKQFANSDLDRWVAGVMISDWQNGAASSVHDDSFFLDNKPNLGTQVYDAMRVAMMLGLKDPEKQYAALPMTTYRNLKDNFPRMLNQMYGRGKALNDLAPFHRVKTYWFNSLLEKGASDIDAHEYDSRDIASVLLAFGNKEFDGWKIYAISPVTSQQKQWAKKMVENCNKAKKKYTELQCDILKDKAIKYGYLVKSQQEVKADIKKALNSNSKHPRADANGHIGPMK